MGDLIRDINALLRGGTMFGGKSSLVSNGPEGAYRRDPETGQWVSSGISKEEVGRRRFYEMKHGGPEGAFSKNPETGCWESPMALDVMHQAKTTAAHDGPQGVY